MILPKTKDGLPLTKIKDEEYSKVCRTLNGRQNMGKINDEREIRSWIAAEIVYKSVRTDILKNRKLFDSRNSAKNSSPQKLIPVSVIFYQISINACAYSVLLVFFNGTVQIFYRQLIISVQPHHDERFEPPENKYLDSKTIYW